MHGWSLLVFLLSHQNAQRKAYFSPKKCRRKDRNWVALSRTNEFKDKVKNWKWRLPKRLKTLKCIQFQRPYFWTRNLGLEMAWDRVQEFFGAIWAHSGHSRSSKGKRVKLACLTQYSMTLLAIFPSALYPCSSRQWLIWPNYFIWMFKLAVGISGVSRKMTKEYYPLA